MKKHSKYLMVLIMTIGVAAIGLFMMSRAIATLSSHREKKTYTVVIDPGHGGFDPGKVGVNQVNEKDINLQIALIVREILEQNDCKVLMTRTQDKGLYEESDTSKKTTDLRKRCEIIDQEEVDVSVSIHQNSFSQESSRGAQVFYQTNSQEGKKFAQIMQSQLISSVDETNHRVAKGNDSYYLLKNTKGTLIIVECGFLSNWEEADLLKEKTYQRKIAWAISIATLQYLGKRTV